MATLSNAYIRSGELGRRGSQKWRKRRRGETEEEEEEEHSLCRNPNPLPKL
jgi:hypothetical protein